MSEFDPQSKGESKTPGNTRPGSSTSPHKPSKRKDELGKSYNQQVASRVPKDEKGLAPRGMGATGPENDVLDAGALDESRDTRDKGQLAFLAIVGPLRVSVTLAEAASKSYGDSLRVATKVAGLRRRGDAAVSSAISAANKDERKKAVIEFLSGLHGLLSLVKSGMVLADLTEKAEGTKAKIGHVWESAKAGWGLGKAGLGAASMADGGTNATPTLDAVAAVGKQTSELAKTEEDAHFETALNALSTWFQAGEDFYAALTLEGLQLDGIDRDNLTISDNQRAILDALLARLRASAAEILAHQLEADALATGHGAAMEPESSSRGLLEQLERSPSLRKGLSLQHVRKRRVEIQGGKSMRESFAGMRPRLVATTPEARATLWSRGFPVAPLSGEALLVPRVTLDFLATRLPVEEVNDSTVTLEARDPEGFLHREEVSEAAWKANPEQLAMDIMKRSRPRPPTTKP